MWGNDSNKLSSGGFEIYKKLNQEREESLSNKLADGKQNPVGVIAILNRQYGWASPYTSDSNRRNTALTAAELPKLADSSSNCTMSESAQDAANHAKEPKNVENKE